MSATSKLRVRIGLTLGIAFLALLGLWRAAHADPSNASIGDFVWSDRNGNGIFDTGEPAQSGVRVSLTGAGPDGNFGTGDDIAFAPQTTNASGNYNFTLLAAGKYRVDLDEATAPPNLVSTRNDPLTVTLGISQVYNDADFGLARPEWVTLAINPAAVTTFAGNGSNTTFDGTGTGASFQEMGGVAVVGGHAYVGTVGSIRKVNLSTGEVTTLAGHPTLYGCTDSTDPSSVRLGSIFGLVTDGYYLYHGSRHTGCEGIRRTSITTGATSMLAPGVFPPNSGMSPHLTFGPDGYLYMAHADTIKRIHPVNGSATVFATLESGTYASVGQSIASDATDLWVAYDFNTSGSIFVRRIKRIPLNGGAAAVLTETSDYLGSFASAGTYLYTSAGGNTGVNLVRRYHKGDGSWINVAGTLAPGYADGTGSEAWLSDIRGIASDGANLWVADSRNKRLRKVVAGSALPSAQPASATTTLAINPAAITTFAGNGSNTTFDGTGTEASFQEMGGVAVVGGHAYVGTPGSIRKVNLSTGEVTTLAGHPTEFGCTDSTDPSSVRLGSIFDLVTDGYYLYHGSRHTGCEGIRRTSITTGATSMLAPGVFPPNSGMSPHLTFGPDGYLYMAHADTIKRIHPVNGSATVFATLESGTYASVGQSIASDATDLWVAYDFNTSGSIFVRRIKRIPLNGGAAAVLTETSENLGSLASAGSYLYTSASTISNGQYVFFGLRRYTKADGTWVNVAGAATPGYADDVGPAAKFSDIRGVVSDGAYLWVADSGNKRLRVSGSHTLLSAGVGYLGWDGYGGWAEDVNAGLGNFVHSRTDLEIATAGPELEMSRTYNSLDTRVGAFGYGWSFNYQMSYFPGPGDGGTILYPDGRREIHTKNPDGTYSPPPGYFSTLAPDGSGFKLTAKDGTVYRFRSDGKLTSITDEKSHALNLTYDGSGKLTRVQDAVSGRGFNFTWTGDYITSVATDSVSAHGGPLTWKYYYNGNKLIKACDPRNNADTGSCFAYAYTNQRLSLVAKPRGNTEVEVAYLSDGKVDWRKDGLGNLTDITYVSNGVVQTTDPRGNQTTQEYDGKYRLTKETNPLGKSSVHEYDIKGNRTKTTDANGNVSEMTYDTRGNVLSIKNPENQITYMSYDSSDNLIARRDARSSGLADNTYATTFEYDAAGNRTKETSPATSGFPSGIVKRWTYTTGSESAIGGGTMPPGLLRKEIDGRGKETTFSYDSKGDLRETIDPVGLKTTFTYDELGRKLTETVISAAFPSGVSTTYAYDVMSNVATVTAPSVQNPVTLSSHQQKTTNSYDANENLVSSTVVDLAGSDPSRVTTFTYDANDRQTGVTDPEGFSITRTYDGAGNVATVTDQEGRVVSTSYDARNLPMTVTVKDFVDDPITGTTPRDLVLKVIGYDDAGRKTSETDALGRRKEFTYDNADRPTKVVLKTFDNRDATTRDITLEEYVYDAAGNVTTEFAGGGKRKVTNIYDAIGRKTSSTLDPDGLNRATSFTYDENANLTKKTVTDGIRTEEVRFVYDDANRKTSETVENGATDVATTFGYDDQNNLTSKTDPRGNLAGANPQDFTTQFTYDEINRLVETVAPAVSVEENGGSATTANPSMLSGYDTFGNLTHSKDPKAKTTTSSFDKLNRVALITHPSYVNPDGVTVTATETFAYDKVGNLTSRTDRRGETTEFTFDKLNRVVRQLDPLVTGEAAKGKIRYVYDDQGNRTSLTDQRGAKTTWTYDDLNRPRTETKVIRRTPNPDDLYTTTFDYDDLGNQTYLKNPNNEVTTSVYNAAGEQTSTTDPLNKVTSFAYDLASRPIRVTDPLGRYSENTYDLAGRMTTTRNYSPAATLLTTTSYGYDAAGNRTSVISPRNFTTTFTYDAAHRLTQVTEPVDASTSITTSYGYDKSGNLTRTTDGEGRITVHTYQAWDLPESTIEPSTTAHPALTNRTFTNTYDAGGLPTKQVQPGGVNLTRNFDDLGRLTTESGSGGGASSVTNTFTYDLAGLKTSASHPSSTINFTYDDRGLLNTATGGAGNVTFTYDSIGRMTQRIDPAGTHNFTWTQRSELDTATDPLTGITFDYNFDDASQPTQVTYSTGASPVTRTYAYDDLGRLTQDVLKDASNVTATSHSYGYDADGNLTSQNINLPGNSQSGAHSYTYDRAGRLSSWTHPSLTGSTTVPIGWDKVGNRTAMGADTFSYDQRNRLVSAVEQVGGIIPLTTTRNFTYAPRGTLSQVTDGSTTTNYTFDASSRLTNYQDALNSVAYTYDSLNRIATRGSDNFTYSGFDLDPVQDGTFTYSRSPDARLLAMSKGADEFLAGLNRHGDLDHLFGTSGAVTDTRVYDPFGKELAETGSTSPNLGFQSDFTDPASSKVWMGARWYDGATANFLSRDSVSGMLQTPISLNRYTYAFGDPLNYFDPDGHWPKFIDNGIAKFKKTGLYKAASRYVAPAVRSFKTATAEVSKTVRIQTARAQHRVQRKYNQVTGGLSLRQLSKGLISKDTAKVAARGFSNFSAGLVDQTTSSLTFGKWGTNIGPLYEDDIYQMSYGVGKVTSQVTEGVTSVAGGAALVKGGIKAFQFVKAAGGLRAAGSIARTTTAAKLASVRSSGATLSSKIRGGSSAPKAIPSRARFIAGSDGGVTDLLNMPNPPNVISIGRAPAYVRDAQMSGARAFRIPDEDWASMVARKDRFGGTEMGSEVWIRNQRFLDEAVARGSDIHLASNPLDPIHEGSFFLREVEYLRSRGAL